MTHTPHELPRRILGDDCEECRSRSGTLDGLSHLDDGNIRKLGDLAAEIKTDGVTAESGISTADWNAVETLRLAARIVFRSGITEEVAR